MIDTVMYHVCDIFFNFEVEKKLFTYKINTLCQRQLTFKSRRV